MNPHAPVDPKKAFQLDLRMGISVLVCCLVATALDALGLKWPVGEMRLEVIQKMTACISCLLCSQVSIDESRTAGINRLIITAVGGLVGVGVVMLDMALGSNPWLLCLMVAAGVVATLELCKLTGVPAINARIGAVTFILVSCTLSGTARVWYALFRFVSTLFGAGVVMLVTWGWQRVAGE